MVIALYSNSSIVGLWRWNWTPVFSLSNEFFFCRSRTTKGYPLKIQATKIVVEPSSMDVDLVTRMLSKVNYPAVLGAIEDLRVAAAAVTTTTTSSGDQQDVDSETLSKSTTPSPLVIPDNIPPEIPSTGAGGLDESILRALHFALFDLHVLEGALICPDTGRSFPIKDGIPNMILHEDEI